ncbi:MAG: hypothetical protein CR982_04470 [Candidatus Cloacimonadota bacterium]|nr:MAG: hypothetical protein CR982_04470 [Candidatus Cloacimonadota bacterium]PIE80057.1 MAG: hypothetical protein CSA15_02230 [Candidatus Delongbacteria bacterium]
MKKKNPKENVFSPRLTKQEQKKKMKKLEKLLEAETPQDFANLYFSTNLTRSDKIMATKFWLKKNPQFSSDDILDYKKNIYSKRRKDLTRKLMTDDLKKLIKKRTLKKYVDYYLRSNFSIQEKQLATRIWLKDHPEYSNVDVQKEKYKHPLYVPNINGRKSPRTDKRNPVIKELMEKSTPEEYIDLYLTSNLTRSQKQEATSMWLKSYPQFTYKDVDKARSKHPEWRKMRRSEDPKQIKRRTKRRFKKNDFSGGSHKKWTNEVLFEFLELNDSYIDRELAKHFKSSIPAVQSIRRRINLSKKILKLEGKEEYTLQELHELVLSDEFVLRRRYKSMLEKKD